LAEILTIIEACWKSHVVDAICSLGNGRSMCGEIIFEIY